MSIKLHAIEFMKLIALLILLHIKTSHSALKDETAVEAAAQSPPSSSRSRSGECTEQRKPETMYILP